MSRPQGDSSVRPTMSSAVQPWIAIAPAPQRRGSRVAAHLGGSPLPLGPLAIDRRLPKEEEEGLLAASPLFLTTPGAAAVRGGVGSPQSKADGSFFATFTTTNGEQRSSACGSGGGSGNTTAGAGGGELQASGAATGAGTHTIISAGSGSSSLMRSSASGPEREFTPLWVTVRPWLPAPPRRAGDCHHAPTAVYVA